jgi:hypothetical protein
MFGKTKTMSKYLAYTTPLKTILLCLGDFSAHFRDVGYKNINEAGKTI